MRKVLVAPLSICLAILILGSGVLAVSCSDGGENAADIVDNGTGATDNGAASVDNNTTHNTSSDNGSSTSETDNHTQKYLFEVEYVNFAWGGQYNGIYIDREGRVFSYDPSCPNSTFQRPEKGVYTRAMLDDKYSGYCVQIGTVDGETLARMTALVGPASQGQYTERENTCYDAGGTAFNAFLFDAETGLYQTVLLRQCGDWSWRNTSAEAATLFDWLKQVMGGGGGGGPCGC